MKNENPFKEKLYHHTLPVTDDLWSRIEPQLPSGGSKKRFPFLWLALAALTLSAGILLMVQLQKKNNSSPRLEQRTYPSIDSTLSNPNDVSLDENSPGTSAAIHEDVQFAALEIANDNTPKANNVARENGSAKNLFTPASKSEPESIIKSKSSNKSSPSQTFSPSASINTKETSVTLTPSTPAIALNENHFEKQSALRTLNAETYFLPGLALNEIESSVMDDFAFGIFTIKPDPSCYTFTGIEKRSNISLDLFIAPGYGPRSFKNGTAETAIYAEARDKTENNRYAMSFGARLNLNVSNEVAVRAGIMYEVIGDVFNYVDSNAMRSSTHIDSFFSSNGTFLYADTVRIFEPGTRVKRIHNRYHHLDIPLLLSYELPMGRARLMVNAGPVINLASGARGQILDPMLVPRHITQTASNPIDVYKTSLGLSVYIGAGALIPISKQFSGLIEPRYLYRIKPVTLESYPLEEQRHFAGVNLGLRYHFQ